MLIRMARAAVSVVVLSRLHPRREWTAGCAKGVWLKGIEHPLAALS